jgi:hypothetical protein
MYFGIRKVSNKLRIHTEVQYRNHTFATVDTEQLLLRIGLNDYFSKNAFTKAGYGHITGYAFEGEQAAPNLQNIDFWARSLCSTRLAGSNSSTVVEQSNAG